MAKKTRSEINYQVKVIHEAARALEHAARCFSDAEAVLDAPKSFYLTDTTGAKLFAQAEQMLKRAKDVAATHPKIAEAWEGELELEV